jgi:hypothetical protein
MKLSRFGWLHTASITRIRKLFSTQDCGWRHYENSKWALNFNINLPVVMQLGQKFLFACLVQQQRFRNTVLFTANEKLQSLLLKIL